MTGPTDRHRRIAELYQKLSGQPGDARPARASTEDLAAAERQLGTTLPDSYAWFQREIGDVPNGPLDIYGVHPDGGDLVRVNLDARRDGHPALPSHLIAFSDDGGGDLVCFDTSARIDGEYCIVWWDHEQDESQRPVAAADTFMAWLEAELNERANEAPGSFADVLPEIYRGWMKNWFG